MTDTRIALLRRLGALAGLALALLAVLAGCGGGTSTVDPFIAKRLITFGDESGLLVKDGADKGRRYGINALNADSVFDCRSNPTWTQSLAGTYGLLFEACPYLAADDVTKPPTVTTYNAIQRAEFGKLAQDLAQQITDQLGDTTAQGGVTNQDLTSVMVGTNDLVQVYEALADRAEYTVDSAKAELDRRGALVAAQVNRLANLGARVLITTVPRLDHTPYGRARIAANGASQAGVMRSLSDAFNARLRRNILQDGSKIGLVMADDLILAMEQDPAIYSLTTAGATEAACTVSPATACTTNTLIADAAVRGNLWADALHLGPAGHRQLAQQFISRALNNPF